MLSPLMQADSSANLIRGINLTSRRVTTLAGQLDVSGSSDGLGSSAKFYSPSGLAIDAGCTFALVVRVEGRGMLRWKGAKGYALVGCTCVEGEWEKRATFSLLRCGRRILPTTSSVPCRFRLPQVSRPLYRRHRLERLRPP